ncbi:AAA family ATPase [Candidatus Woesearchaeota archaeon]|nr:AAA family ATPase [Candidatus Woesearchaeota archaeon]
MDQDMDYLNVLNALNEIPFSVGKKLLAGFLMGDKVNESIQRNQLSKKEHFGSMAYSEKELSRLIDRLIVNDLIKLTSLSKNKFWKVLELTEKGREEIRSPSLYKKKLSFSFKDIKTEITEKDIKAFEALDDFLGRFNDCQKKAIISEKENILCIAGAGSGKTTALTKRIEFLVKYRSADPKKILAITFTRKARQEMISRLKQDHSTDEVNIETFNSFCEKMLRKYGSIAYNKQVRVISYRDRFMIMKKALQNQRIGMDRAVDIYFSFSQKKGKTREQLANIFMNDCFFIRDYLKFKNKDIRDASPEDIEPGHEKSAELVTGICMFIDSYMQKAGLRDFADQLIDTIKLFKEHKELIPEFDHVLIDEYQDINSTQIELIDILSLKNLFCVGDPRQSIYGWRGSDIKYILNFEEKYSGCEVIALNKNYRSTRHIVSLVNKFIEDMGLPDLEPAAEGEKDIKLLKFRNENSEFEFIIQRILAADIPREEIFVLARTNKQLNELSDFMKRRGIRHIVKSDEMKKSVIAGKGEVTLATIHSIKGMEAEMVFVIGCTNSKFPCRASEHPVIDMIKVDEYDKEEEEKRLLYVAMSRAKKSLYISYSGGLSYFIDDNVMKKIDKQELNIKASAKKIKKGSSNIIAEMKDWRYQTSQELGIPAYMVMHDKTIEDLAEKMPSTPAELNEVHGFGPSKISRFGKDVLDIVNRH